MKGTVFLLGCGQEAEEEGKEVTRMREQANYLLIKLFN